MNKKDYRIWINKQKELVSKFKFTVDDIHNIYDLTYMIDWRTMDMLKLNKLDKWFRKFVDRIENIALYEIDKENPTSK